MLGAVCSELHAVWDLVWFGMGQRSFMTSPIFFSFSKLVIISPLNVHAVNSFLFGEEKASWKSCCQALKTMGLWR